MGVGGEGLRFGEFEENAEAASSVLAIEICAECVCITMADAPAPGFSAIAEEPVPGEAALPWRA